MKKQRHIYRHTYLYIIPIYVFLQIWGSLGEPLTFRIYIFTKYESHHQFFLCTQGKIPIST